MTTVPGLRCAGLATFRDTLAVGVNKMPSAGITFTAMTEDVRFKTPTLGVAVRTPWRYHTSKVGRRLSTAPPESTSEASAPQVRHSFSGLNREHSLANETKTPENSSGAMDATSFGTRGSQVQILPLRKGNR